MRQIKTVDDIKQLGTILSVWAHPDDESFNSAGIMAAAVANGQKVICITATKGEAGVQDAGRWPADQLGDIRAKEMAEACKILGITNHNWLGYHDGDCDQVPDIEAIGRIKKFIDKYQPDTIFTFGPEGLTGHPDHKAVSRWVNLAAKDSSVTVYHAVEEKDTYENFLKNIDKQFNFYFNIDKPPLRALSDCDLAFQLTAQLVQKKSDALHAMTSQYEALFKAVPAHILNSVFAYECFVRANR